MSLALVSSCFCHWLCMILSSGRHTPEVNCSSGLSPSAGIMLGVSPDHLCSTSISARIYVKISKRYCQIRAQEDTRSSLELISNHLRTMMQQDKVQEILLAVSDLREQIDTNCQKQNGEFLDSLSGDLQACNIFLSISTISTCIYFLLEWLVICNFVNLISPSVHLIWSWPFCCLFKVTIVSFIQFLEQAIRCSLKTLHQKDMPLSILPPKVLVMTHNITFIYGLLRVEDILRSLK